MLSLLTRKFGNLVQIDGKEFFTFPSALSIHMATIEELRACGLGYRSKAIKSAAESIVSDKLDFDLLKKASYEQAKQELLQIYGIGNKIADCVLLFSLEKLEAFPIDVWIARALARHYMWLHEKQVGEKMTSHQYKLLSGNARDYFGKYAGYAQQYIYYHMRNDAGKKW
jgi:N-glycosylase/DNA lyase